MWQYNRECSQAPTRKFSLTVKSHAEHLDLSCLFESLVAQLAGLANENPAAYGFHQWPMLGSLTAEDLEAAVVKAVQSHPVAVSVGRGAAGSPVTYGPSARNRCFSLTNTGLYATECVKAAAFIVPYRGKPKVVVFESKPDCTNTRSFEQLTVAAQNQAVFHAEECLRQKLGPDNRKSVLLTTLDFGGVTLSIYVDGMECAGVGSFVNHADGDTVLVNAKLKPLYFWDDTVGLGIFADRDGVRPYSELLISYAAHAISFDGEGETWSQGDGWSQGPRLQSRTPDQSTLQAQQALDWLLQLRLLHFSREEALNPDIATVPGVDMPAFLTALAATRVVRAHGPVTQALH